MFSGNLHKILRFGLNQPFGNTPRMKQIFLKVKQFQPTTASICFQRITSKLLVHQVHIFFAT